MKTVAQFVGSLFGDPAPSAPTPAAGVATDDANQVTKRFAHSRVTLDGVVWHLRLDRLTGELRVRRNHARKGCDLAVHEVVQLAARLMKGSLEL